MEEHSSSYPKFHFRHEGYLRKWDKTGRLIEEMWYHLGVLHGCWRTWNEAGIEEIVGDAFV